MKPEFTFALGERVFVPGIKGCQAVVMSSRADIINGNRYVLRFLGRSGSIAECDTTETELCAANCREYTDYRAIRLPESLKTDKQRADWIRDQAHRLREAAKPWDRLARLGFNDGPTPKSKSKKRK